MKENIVKDTYLSTFNGLIGINVAKLNNNSLIRLELIKQKDVNNIICKYTEDKYKQIVNLTEEYLQKLESLSE